MPEDENTAATSDTLKKTIVSMAVESWRFSRVFDSLLMKLGAGEQNRFKSQFRWYIKKMKRPWNKQA
jgi:hypothetical protein